MMDSVQLATGISKTTSSVGKVGGGFFSKFFGLLARNKFWTFTFIVLMIILIGSIKESIETKSPEPLLFNFGGLVIVPDEHLYNTIKNVEDTYPVEETIESTVRWEIWLNKAKHIWNITKWWWGIFTSLWMIIAVGNFIRKLRIKFVNDSEKAKALWLAIKIMLIMYLITTPIFFTYHRAGETLPEWEEARTDVDFWISIAPFKGVMSLFKHLIFDKDYFTASYERAKGIYIPEVINATGS